MAVMTDYVKISIADEIDLADDRVQCERADCHAPGYYRIEIALGVDHDFAQVGEAWWACDGNNHEHILIAEMITRMRAEALRVQGAGHPAFQHLPDADAPVPFEVVGEITFTWEHDIGGEG
jgi:hypothetical protein